LKDCFEIQISMFVCLLTQPFLKTSLEYSSLRVKYLFCSHFYDSTFYVNRMENRMYDPHLNKMIFKRK
jgi:hypothetical protein